jgi:hypothetical protein
MGAPHWASKEPTANEKVRANFESNTFEGSGGTNRLLADPRCPRAVAKLHWNVAVSLALHEIFYERPYLVNARIWGQRLDIFNPPEYVPPENGDRIQCTKRRVLNKGQDNG